VTRLANALAPLFADVEPLREGLKRYIDAFVAADHANTTAKLGLAECRDDDPQLMQDLQGLLQSAEVDMTIFFRALADIDPGAPTLASFAEAFYDEAKREQTEPAFIDWLTRYGARLRDDALPANEHRMKMNTANPRYVMRNYLAQQVIDRAELGDEAGIAELLDVMRRPYDDQPGREAFARRRPDWARQKAGCSMLSCSS
jgi:uncharacterized protein YdiU (UPF0061 family)